VARQRSYDTGNALHELLCTLTKGRTALSMPIINVSSGVSRD
jgi:hypothetical protein